MESNVKIMIVDDSPLYCAQLSDALNTFPNFDVVETVSDPTEAVDAILSVRPDVLLLDIVMPNIDGEEILERLFTMSIPETKIIIVSSLSNEKVIQRSMSLGAQYYILKPFDINSLVKKINGMYDGQGTESIAPPQPRKPTDEKIKKRIAEFLMSSGINPKLKGFFFLKDSIYFVFNSGNDLCSVTKIVYPYVADIYETEPERVERSIRSAIEKGFSNYDGKMFYFTTVEPTKADKSKKPIPSNRQFIFTIAEYIKNTIQDPYAL